MRANSFLVCIVVLLAACGESVTPAGGADKDRDGFGVAIDCDDNDNKVFPGAAEVPYDGVDQNCDGKDLDDLDGDGHKGGAAGDDCNDADPAVHPGAVDVCGNGVNEDCAGGDLECINFDADGDGKTPAAGDCDDSNPAIKPGASETTYNEVDDDCDPATADDDLDEDRFDKNGGGDCDDANSDIHPSADEVPYDGVDQDCSGSDLTDVDRDGYDACGAAGGNGAGLVAECDCEDTRPDSFPGATEVCGDGVDNDCAGDGDEACAGGGGTDADGDHFTLEQGGDCDDANSDLYPGAREEPYDGIDQDCDGFDLTDVDRDGHDSDAVTGGDDCDDGRPDVHPGLHEIPYNHLDEDCDGQDFAGHPFNVHRSPNAERPAVAFCGGVYLVVWEDLDDSGSDIVEEIAAQRVAPDGTLVGEEIYVTGGGIPAGDLADPRVACAGDAFVVVWRKYAPNGSCECYQWDLYGQFVDPASGDLLFAEPRAIAVEPSDDEDAAVACIAGNCLVAYRGFGLYATRVGLDGTVGAPEMIASDGYEPAVGASADAFLVAYSEYNGSDVDVLARRVGAGGGPDADVHAIAGGPQYQYAPAVGFDGANYLITWVSDRSNGTDVLGKFIAPPPEAPPAVVLDEPILISNAPGYRWDQGAAYVNGFFVVAWTDGRWEYGNSIYGQKVDIDGALLDEGASWNRALVANPDDAENFDGFGGLASDGTRVLLVWHRGGSLPPGLVIVSGPERAIRAALVQP
jgi:hypothetical protein